jgi:hypothetical protein
MSKKLYETLKKICERHNRADAENAPAARFESPAGGRKSALAQIIGGLCEDIVLTEITNALPCDFNEFEVGRDWFLQLFVSHRVTSALYQNLFNLFIYGDIAFVQKNTKYAFRMLLYDGGLLPPNDSDWMVHKLMCMLPSKYYIGAEDSIAQNAEYQIYLANHNYAIFKLHSFYKRAIALVPIEVRTTVIGRAEIMMYTLPNGIPQNTNLTILLNCARILYFKYYVERLPTYAILAIQFGECIFIPCIDHCKSPRQQYSCAPHKYEIELWQLSRIMFRDINNTIAAAINNSIREALINNDKLGDLNQRG